MTRIKILFFIETLDGGGAEKVLRNLVNNMDQSRFDITIQTVFPDNAAALLAPGICYRSLYSDASRKNVLRYRLEAFCGLTYPLHMMDDYDIECAYLECGSTKILAGSTNKHASKLAWVHCDLKKAMRDPEAFAEKTAKYYAKYDNVVCVSKGGKQSFDELFGEGSKSVVLYNTVDREEILRKAQTPPEESVDHPLVVSLGRLAEPKNYLRMLKAHKRLVDEGIHHKLLILGEGPQRPDLESYIRENRLEKTAFLPGFSDNPYPWMKTADVLACSSVYECFSTFVTEGLILGKPIVTTDVSGMRELLGDSRWGMIVDCDDAAFYEGLKKMLTDPQLRQKYALQAKLRGMDFSTETLVKETERFFFDLVR